MIGTRYELKILHQCGKRVKTKSQKVLGANSNVCRSYRGKTGRGGANITLPPHPSSWVGLRFQHSLSMKISLGKSTKFPIPSESVLTTWISLKINLERVTICKRSFLHFISYHIPICFFQLCRKICKQSILHLFSFNQMTIKWLVD